MASAVTPLAMPAALAAAPEATAAELYAQLSKSGMAFALLVAEASRAMDATAAAAFERDMAAAAFEMHAASLERVAPPRRDGVYSPSLRDVIFRKLPYFQFAAEAEHALAAPDTDAGGGAATPAAPEAGQRPQADGSAATLAGAHFEPSVDQFAADHEARAAALAATVARRDVREETRRLDHTLRAVRVGLVSLMAEAEAEALADTTVASGVPTCAAVGDGAAGPLCAAIEGVRDGVGGGGSTTAVACKELLRQLDEAAVLLRGDLLDRLDAERRRVHMCGPCGVFCADNPLFYLPTCVDAG